ncbi:uncharacterized protein LOC118319263 [Lates japonicus]
MLAGVTHVAETKCSHTQNTTLCSVPPGEPVFVQVINNASNHQVRCNKQLPSGSMKVFVLMKEKVTIYEPFRNRTEFFINNGTFKMTNLERNDSGQYIIEVFDSNGVFVKEMNIQLNVQEQAFPLLIPVCAGAGALLLLMLVLVSCCVCRHRKKSGSRI